MFLKKLYSEPSGLFRSGKPEHPHTIVFKNGFNFIFGRKDVENNETKQPLNGIGKSTLIDLIDFCLLAEFNRNNRRLHKEKGKLGNYKIVLEFEVNNIDYIIKRKSIDKKVEFGKLAQVEEMAISEAKSKLFQIIFQNSNYKGITNEKWYRNLMSFFLKIHKKKKGGFIDPINFLTQHNKVAEINQYHFFLLGIDNKLICKNFELQKDVRDRNTAISQVKKIVEKNYDISINEVDSEISKLKNELEKIKVAIEAFKLAEHHKNVEQKLNNLTAQIKVLAEENFWIDKKIKSYRDSYELKDVLSESQIRSIERLYAELNNKLSGIIHKSLNEAVEFRKKLAQSRKEFLEEEIQDLEAKMRRNDEEKNKLDEERRKLFLLLQSKEAVTDLTQAFYYLGEKQKEISDLESKIRTYRDLEAEKQLYRKQDADIYLEIKDFLQSIKNQIIDFENIFSYVYDNIYPSSASSGFSITLNSNADKVAIQVYFEKEESKGWNQGRTLVYDIAVMLHAVQQHINMPRFLVHDGIFDGMDKSQFVELYHFIQNLQKEGTRFQYIVTMMEEGTLNERFGDTDELSPEKITDDAIAVLTPNKKLWTGN